MGQFDAETARELVKAHESRRHLEFLKKAIVKACEEGFYKVVIRDEPYAQCLRNDNGCGNPALKQALLVLREEGFELSQFWEERQFVDMGLEISWKE